MFNQLYERAFEHLATVMESPETAFAEQQKYNKERYADVLKSLRMLPMFLPVKIKLPAVAQGTPIKGSTDPKKNYDVMITGIITDGENKRINIYREIDNFRQLVKVGTDGDAKLSLDAIAGKSKETAGITGVQRLQPFVLKKGDSISLEIYKDDDGAEDVNVVFTGFRVVPKNDPSRQLTGKVKDAVIASIEETLTPETRWAAIPVVFSEGRAFVETPESDEPLTLLGFRSTVSNAQVVLSYNDDEKLPRDYFPIWALANEKGNYTANYNPLLNGIFLEPGEKLYIGLKNTIDGVNFAQNGQLEVLVKKP